MNKVSAIVTLDSTTKDTSMPYCMKPFATQQKKTLGVGLLLFDIDKFKNINDTYGHWVADMIISQLARRIDKSIRKSDIFARVGGDEFAILAMNIQQKSDLITTCSKIFKELEQPFKHSTRGCIHFD